MLLMPLSQILNSLGQKLPHSIWFYIHPYPETLPSHLLSVRMRARPPRPPAQAHARTYMLPNTNQPDPGFRTVTDVG